MHTTAPQRASTRGNTGTDSDTDSDTGTDSGSTVNGPIETWPHWRDREATALRHEHGCTVAEARQAAENLRDLWDSYVLEAFEAGQDFTARAAATLPAYLLHRMTGTPRWQNRDLRLHPDENPLRRYQDRLCVLNTTAAWRTT